MSDMAELLIGFFIVFMIGVAVLTIIVLLGLTTMIILNTKWSVSQIVIVGCGIFILTNILNGSIKF